MISATLPPLPTFPSLPFCEAINFVHCMKMKWRNPRHCQQPKGGGGGRRRVVGQQVKGHILTFLSFYLNLLRIVSHFLFFFFVFSPLVCYLPCKRGVWGRGLGWQGAWFLTRFWLLLFSFLSSCSSTKHFFLCLHFCIKLKPHFPGIFPPLFPGTVSLSVFFFFSFSASICPFGHLLYLFSSKWRTALEAAASSLMMSMLTIRSANKHYPTLGRL